MPILLIAAATGLILGWLRARVKGHAVNVPSIRVAWLVLIGYLPQFLVFQFAATRTVIPDVWAASALVGSQLLLLGFVWLNRRIQGFIFLGTGLALNLLVILLNGGLMPISPTAVQQVVFRNTENRPTIQEITDRLPFGSRVGDSKDVLLPADEIQFSGLADRFFLPAWMPFQAAFSMGDLFIAAGAFWLLWGLGNPPAEGI